MVHLLDSGPGLRPGLFSPTLPGGSRPGHDAGPKCRGSTSGVPGGRLFLPLCAYAAASRPPFRFMGRA